MSNLVMRVLDQRTLDAARIGALVVLTLLLAWVAARIVWLLIAPTDAVSTLTPRALPTPVGQAAEVAVRADISLLMKQNPFESGNAGDRAVVIDAPETDLNLKLVALFMSTNDGGATSATIITPDNKATRFEPGDEILPGVTLQRVLSDRAIISRNGREETIMRSGREAGLSVIGDTSTMRSEAGRVAQESPMLFEPGISALTLIAGINGEVQRNGNDVTGFVLRPRGDASLMQSAGLEPGDRLVKLNDQPVAEIDPSTFAAEFGARGTAIVDIVRSGEARTIEIRFEEE